MPTTTTQGPRGTRNTRGAQSSGRSYRTQRTLRTLSQILMLVVFILLILAGKLQLWFIIFGAAGIGLSLFIGRAYCGWICPMGTLLRAQTWLMKKMKIPRITLSQSALSRTWFRMIFLVLFIAVMVLIQRSGASMPFLLFLTGAAVLVSFIFHESFWHRQICPFGTILSFTARIAPRRMQVQQSGCIGCGKCEPVCPNLAITAGSDGTTGGKSGRKKREILAHECFLCNNCRDACPVETIDWKSRRQTAQH